MKDKIKKIEEALDLKKMFPNYFTHKIFRTATILMIVLFFITFVINDFKLTNTFAACPENANKSCRNPFYLCDNLNINYSNYFNDGPTDFVCLDEIHWKVKPLCDVGECDIEFLNPGEFVGNPPNFLVQNFSKWVFCIWALAFLFNHLWYMKRTGKTLYRREE